MSASLNPKERQRLYELHGRFSVGTFSETDASALLVLLREKSKGGPIKELADSIAHSERNSGEFFRRVRQNQSALNNLGKQAGVVDSRQLFSSSEFVTNLNETLHSQGFDELSPQVIDLVFLCSLSLLQGGSVKGGKTFGELHMTLTSDAFELAASMPIEHDGKTVHASFPLAAIANRWLPVCNPRARLESSGPVVITVENFAPLVRGFEAFHVHVERAPPIIGADLDGLVSSIPRLHRTVDGLVFTPSAGVPMPLRHDGTRLTVQGLPEFFRAGTEYERALKEIRLRLAACVHDDAGAHWFLEGLAIAPDGFHSHWVGRGSATCTRPL
jgi:hypothetical protein